jgi:hypothetical protein
VRVSADLISGERASVTRHLRFAVGDATSTDEALAARPEAVAEPQPTGASDEASGAGGGGGPWLVVGLVVVAAGLALALLVVVLRGRSVRRRVERERAAGSAP